VKVDLQQGEVAVTYDDRLMSPERLAELLKAAGFSTTGQRRN
jgi:hypothetical protein